MSNQEKPIVVFDLETTGADIATDEIIQFAAVKVESPSWDVVATLHFRCRPEIPIHPDATAVHGIKVTDLIGEKRFEHYAVDVVQFFRGCDVGGYNIASFDLPILDRQLAQLGYVGEFDKSDIVDSFLIYREDQPRNLANAYKFYNNKELVDAHDALADTKATAEILAKQLKNYQQPASEIAEKFSLGYKQRVGFTSHIIMKGGEYVFGFGKHKDQPIKNHIGYLKWMLTSDFSETTKQFIRDFLKC